MQYLTVKNLFVIIIFLIVVALATLFLNTYFSKTNPPFVKTTGTQNPTLSENIVTLPINPRLSFIAGFNIYYSYGALVKKLLPAPDGLEIITDITDPNIPRFVITDKTVIQYKLDDAGNNLGNNVELGPAKIEDITVGSKVVLPIYYTLRGDWDLPEVYIMTTDPSSAPFKR